MTPDRAETAEPRSYRGFRPARVSPGGDAFRRSETQRSLGVIAHRMPVADRSCRSSVGGIRERKVGVATLTSELNPPPRITYASVRPLSKGLEVHSHTLPIMSSTPSGVRPRGREPTAIGAVARGVAGRKFPWGESWDPGAGQTRRPLELPRSRIPDRWPLGVDRWPLGSIVRHGSNGLIGSNGYYNYKNR